MRWEHVVRHTFILLLVIMASASVAAEGDLTIIAKNEQSVRLEEVSVTVEGDSYGETEETDDRGRATFNDLEAAGYDVTLSHDDYRERTIHVSVENNTETTKHVVLEHKVRHGDLSITVIDKDNNRIQDAEVRIYGQDNDYEDQQDTDGSGEASFDEIPVGPYDVFVDHEDYDSGHVTVDVRSDATAEGVVELGETSTTGPVRDIEIRQVVVPATLKKGSTFEISVKVENTGDQNEAGITASADAFSQTTVSDRFELEEGENRWIVLESTVPRDASGPEEIEVGAGNSNDRDILFITTEVSDLFASMEVSPDPSSIGEAVFVNGRIVHDTGEGASGVSANVYLGNQYVTSITTDATGQYSTFVRPERSGSYTVRLENSNVRVSKVLHIQPDIELTEFQAPTEVDLTGTPQACATVNGKGQDVVTVRLKVNQANVSSRNVQLEQGQKRVCFNIPNEQPGRYHVFIEAVADDITAGQGQFVTVTEPEPDITVTATPRISVRQGQTAALNATVSNPADTARTVTVRLTGIEQTWIDNEETTLTLGPGQTANHTFQVTPQQAGIFSTTVEVENQFGSIVSDSTEITVESRVSSGIADTVDSVSSAISTAVDRTVQTVTGSKFALIAAVLVVIAFLLRKDLKEVLTPDSLEPRNW